MGLFGFGKKKEESAPACACQCGCPTAKADVSDVTKETGSAANETPSIKVLGAGCASCHALLENTKKSRSKYGSLCRSGVCDRYGQDCWLRCDERPGTGGQREGDRSGEGFEGK